MTWGRYLCHTALSLTRRKKFIVQRKIRRAELQNNRTSESRTSEQQKARTSGVPKLGKA
jgi:hypothetical protein